MKKYLSLILAALLVTGALASCAARWNTPAYADSAITGGEYEKLLALRFDGYEKMTVAAFQEKVGATTDTEEYLNLFERLSGDTALQAQKDAEFLFYILPLAGDDWKTRSYSGEVTSSYTGDKARLEYSFTLTILNPDALLVKDYNDTRLGVMGVMQDTLRNKTKDELRDEAAVRADVQSQIDHLLGNINQTKGLAATIEFAYFPLPAAGEKQQVPGENEQEPRREEYGTEEDYRSLLALKTADYRSRPVAEFNMDLLEWANEDYERMERINCDVACNDFSVNLSGDELSFAALTTWLSGAENGEFVQSNYTGRKEEDPVYNQYLPTKTAGEYGCGAWCELFYQLSYHIADKKTLTVGERDRAVGGMIAAVERFWNDASLDELLAMTKEDIVSRLDSLAAAYSTGGIQITIGAVHFEQVNETPVSAAYEKLVAYKTEDYEQQSIAGFNASLAPTDDALTAFLATNAALGALSPDDENYDFLSTTIFLSANELYCAHKGEEFNFFLYPSKKSRPCDYVDEYGDTVYDFTCFVSMTVTYTIDDPALVSVAERDGAFLTLREEMQNYLNGLSETEIVSGDIRTMLTDKSAELAKSLSTENMKLSPCEISLIEINDGGTEITP